jgi:hypothetical protein
MKGVREHATLCERKTGTMFTPDWFRPRPYRHGQDRAVVESQQGRRASAACLSLRRTTAGPTVPEGDRFGGQSLWWRKQVDGSRWNDACA